MRNLKKEIILHTCLWLALIAFTISFSGCKTRKVQNLSVETSKVTSLDQQSQVQAVDSSRSVDHSTEASTKHTEAKNTLTTSVEMEADSIVLEHKKGQLTKTTIYPKGKFIYETNGTGGELTNETLNKNTDVTNTRFQGKDSTGHIKQSLKQDSTFNKKDTEAIGSGTTWATWVPIIGGVVLIVALILVFMYFKK
jgi:hypothetical protein